MARQPFAGFPARWRAALGQGGFRICGLGEFRGLGPRSGRERKLQAEFEPRRPVDEGHARPVQAGDGGDEAQAQPIAGRTAAAALIRKIGAEHIIISTDCGQTGNVYPTDCLALAARGLRAHGITQRELDLMYKINPAKLLRLPPPEETAAVSTTTHQ